MRSMIRSATIWARAAGEGVGRLDLLAAEAQRRQQVEARVVELGAGEPQHVAAEGLAQGPAVEDVADVEGAGEPLLDGVDRRRGEAPGAQRLVIDDGGADQRSVADD